MIHMHGPHAALGAFDGAALDALVAAHPDMGWCCDGAAIYGPDRCTCWEPVYDVEQAALDLTAFEDCQTEMCADCAYRPGSPERSGDGADDLMNLPYTGQMFWCHQGMRRVVSWRHPSGVELPAGAGDYRPPVRHRDGQPIPYQADGQPGLICGGWLRRRLKAISS